MPELPEVETMRRGVACVAGSPIEEVEQVQSKLRPLQILPSLQALRQRARGRTIVAVGRVGKRVVLELDSGERIVIEPRMTGRVLLADPPDKMHLRLVFHLRGPQSRLLFWDSRGLGVVHLLTAEQFATALGPEKLGPDALEISTETLRKRLSTSRRAIKVALLDQRALVGIGNLYASEILHRARLHPGLPCNRLRPVQWKRLQAAMREVLEEAVLHQGSTLADGMYRNAQNEAGSFQDHHRVYQRAGEPCLQCGRGPIVRIVQAQRSTFYCPACQRQPR
ncbi:MAG: bifunctional DNA-formamidopyrimidine glycosylase/DNA-(apurinic or apyrimidinic site) lyase [Thermoguttaceae bacterium]|jgi:formamidopyrimidine-DNA glycosylase